MGVINLPSLPENVTGLADLAVYANDVTEGYFGSLTLLLIYFFFLSSFSFDHPIKSFMAASTLLLLFSVGFYLIGLIVLNLVFINLGLIFISVILWWFSASSSGV